MKVEDCSGGQKRPTRQDKKKKTRNFLVNFMDLDVSRFYT